MNYLGLDIGTTGVKAVVFDQTGKQLGAGLAEYTLETPKPDIVELNPEVYWQASCAAIKSTFTEAGISAETVCGIAVTGQVETLIMVDASGKPVRKAIVWLDNRAKKEAAELEKEFGTEKLFRLSGQTEMLPCWPAPKILHFRTHEPNAFQRTAKYLMVEDYIVWHLTGKYRTCRGLLPSTLYYDIRTQEYDSAMLTKLEISKEQLPKLGDVGAVLGKCQSDNGILSPGTLVVGAPLDHVCGNLGCGCAGGKGLVSETTGCTLALCAAFPKLIYDKERRISTYLGAERGSFVLLPWAPTAGMLLKHFRDEFTSGIDYPELNTAAAAVPPGSEGLVLLPHCAGAVSPICNPHARGVAYGITLAHKQGHWARAIMESVAYLLRDNIETLRSFGLDIRELRALGGAAKSPLWLQIKADVLNLPVTVTACSEATAFGAAMLAAVAAGEYPDLETATKHMVKTARKVLPGKNANAYSAYYSSYQKLNSLLLPTFKGS
ncbi:MAG: FGGY family carbohydrate kinase [Lentisphaeria bacterium]